jgi:O-antigen ligase
MYCLSIIEICNVFLAIFAPNFLISFFNTFFIADVSNWVKYDLERGRIFPLFGLFIFPPFLLFEMSRTLNTKKRKLFLLNTFLLIAVVVAAVYSGYRQVLLSTIFSLIISILFFGEKIGPYFIKYLKLDRVFLIGISVAFVVVFSLQREQSGFSRLLNSFSRESGETLIRLYLWRQGMSIFENNIFFGTGTGKISTYMNVDLFYTYQNDIEQFVLANRAEVLDHPHSFLLQLFAEQGFLGGLIIFSWLYFSFFTFYFTNVDGKEKSTHFFATIILHIILLSFLVDNLFTVPTVVSLQLMILFSGFSYGVASTLSEGKVSK